MSETRRIRYFTGPKHELRKVWGANVPPDKVRDRVAGLKADRRVTRIEVYDGPSDLDELTYAWNR